MKGVSMQVAPAGPLTPFGPGARRALVVGHPGHELAIYGMLQRHPPEVIVVVTDGGGARRVSESREGLRRIGLLERTRYLDLPEQRFYDALLDGDVGFVREAAGAVRDCVRLFAPTDVLCDAVEFYNPLHDITLPIVRTALDGWDTRVYEVPLVYEVSGDEEQYAVQRVPDSMSDRRLTFALTEDELEAKVTARNEVYCSLHTQAGPELLGVSPAEMAHEEIALASDRVTSPGAGGRALRYERRARLLHAQGNVARMITYGEHFGPMLDALGVPRDLLRSGR